MSSIRELTTEEKQQIMQLIFTEFPNLLRPIAITKVGGTNFFPWYMNRYDGWFCDVIFYDHKETWFIVKLNGWHDNDWYCERIS